MFVQNGDIISQVAPRHFL